MEVSAWRHLPQATPLQGACSFRRLWHTAPGLRVHHVGLFCGWATFTSAPRLHSPRHLTLVHLRWCFVWLRLSSLLQDVEGRRLEEDDALDCILIPRIRLYIFLRAEPFHLGDKVVGRCALWHHVRAPGFVVWHLCATCVPWGLLWLQKGARLVACTHKSDPSAGPEPALVHNWCVQLARWWNPSIWCCIYGALLHNVFHLVTPVLFSSVSSYW